MAFERLPPTAPPQVSPYGDDWDLLWIGHCAQTFPADDKPAVARGRVIQANDSTVPARHHLESPFIQPFMLADEYPDHTRAVHHSRWGACTSAYAVSQRGARKIVLQLGLKEAVAPVDLLLRAFCDSDAGRGENQCLTTQPSLVNHHRPVGPIAEDSDIRDAGTGFRHVGETKMIRLSARLNAEALIWGGTDLKDRYPDAVDGAKLP
ncbi:hypothetical protein CDD83_6089 [Cordyceps sp. RAO-2017]|nr:hypothetical protein CDD83_6089 [Cordyceps sp. RAO-2017]